ncbi:hypothetical protein Taro_044488 [Colocasia esculenta]|uniref:Uncharacterized protein n=1 Tax=Colocasia esculenta TaxID=4460 RepID=A0A843WYF4_COLES|nr:hypothetical protein [Colocasia esculenta]
MELCKTITYPYYSRDASACRDLIVTPYPVVTLSRRPNLRDLSTGRVFSRGGFQSSPLGNHPQNMIQHTTEGGDHGEHVGKPLNHANHPQNPTNMDLQESTLDGNLTQPRAWIPHTPTSQTMRKTPSQGGGEHAKVRGSRVPTSTSRADPLGPSRRNDHLLLAPSNMNTFPARTGRLHLSTSTTSMKNRREIARELERGRRRREKGERGRMGCSLSFKPTASKTRWVGQAG